ncbi:MAG: dihydroorotase, partial [Microbacterium sp.]|nr:dihydroorotase [Microbacterium sp.]
ELTFYDAEARGTFTTGDLRGRSRNSPYVGRELPGRVVWTVHQGRPTVAEGRLVETGVGA